MAVNRTVNFKIVTSIMIAAMFMPSMAYAQCDVVAVVFETNICQKDIAVEDSQNAAQSFSAEMRLGLENDRLAAKIRSIAAQHLLSEESYTPNDDEIDTYIEFHEKSKALQNQHDLEIIETIETLLETYEYTDIHRKRLEDGLATFQKSIKQSIEIEEDDRLFFDDMRKRFGDDAVAKTRAQLKESRRDMAAGMISAWKMNKALYEKYGGRIIFQQFGIEPIDAYREQLSDIRKVGGLKIIKPAYKDVFAGFERYLDMGHNYLSDDDGTSFDQPYWETADPNLNHQEAIDEYKAVPHK